MQLQPVTRFARVAAMGVLEVGLVLRFVSRAGSAAESVLICLFIGICFGEFVYAFLRATRN